MNDGAIASWAIPQRIYFHCGWAIRVTPDFESELIEGRETLRIYGPGEHREIFLSSMVLQTHDGKPFRKKDVLAQFPPDDMGGVRYVDDEEGFAGSALWFHGDDDLDGPAWVLMGMVVSEEAQKIARCTIVCEDAADHDWALETWRSVCRETPELAELKGKTLIIREL
jgi:hypothetical protein